jgi:hypothetical protein
VRLWREHYSRVYPIQAVGSSSELPSQQMI